MKKLILFIIVGLVGLFGHVRPARAGTNAFLPFNTNTYQVPVANWWTSNAVAIESALNGIGFTGGTNGGNYFTPIQFFTNGSGQVQIDALSAALLTNTVAMSNLPSFLVTNNSATLVTHAGGVSNNFSAGGPGFIWSNAATGAWGQIPTNGHLHITDEYATTYDFHTNGAFAIITTNGQSLIWSNGLLTLNGGSVQTNGSTVIIESGMFTGASMGGSNSLGVTGLVSATGGATPYANNYYPGMVYGFCDFNSFGGRYSSTNWTNDVWFVATNLPLFTHGPVPFIWILDAGFTTTNRSNGQTNGSLVVNTNLWADTPQHYAQFVHSFYGQAAIVYSEDDNIGGINTQAVPGSSTGLVFAGLGTNVEYDAQTIATWGFDGMKYDRISNDGTTNFATALLRLETAFKQVATNRPCIFWTDDYLASLQGANGVDSDAALNAGLFSGTIFCPNSDWGGLGGSLSNISYLELVTNLNVCAGLSQLNTTHTWVVPREMENNYAGTISTCAYKMHAELGAPMFFSTFTQADPDQTSYLNNAEVKAINDDPLRATGKPILGINNYNTNQVWIKNLANGDLAVAFLNCTTNVIYTNMPVNWTQLGLAANTQVQVFDVFDGTNCGIFSNSFAVTVNPYDCFLTRFHNVANNYLAGTAPNLSIGGTAATATTATVANNVVAGIKTTNETAVAGVSAAYTNFVVLGQTPSGVNFSGGSYMQEANGVTSVLGFDGLSLSGFGNGVSVSDNFSVSGQFIGPINLAGSNVLRGSWNVPGVTFSSLVNGENGDIDIGTNTYVILTGPTGAFTVDGFVAKGDGREFTAVNPTGQSWTLRNLSGLEFTAANRIITGQGADLILTNNPSLIKFHYQGSSNAWIVTGFNAPSTGVALAGTVTNGGAANLSGVVIITNIGAGVLVTNPSSGTSILLQPNGTNLDISTTATNEFYPSGFAILDGTNGYFYNGLIGLSTWSNGQWTNTYGPSGWTNLNEWNGGSSSWMDQYGRIFADALYVGCCNLALNQNGSFTANDLLSAYGSSGYVNDSGVPYTAVDLNNRTNYLASFTSTAWTNTNAWGVIVDFPNGVTNLRISNSIPASIFGPVTAASLYSRPLGVSGVVTNTSASMAVSAAP
jgi:hypothetical protein